MSPQAHPPIDRTAIAARIDAFFASVTVWLCAVSVWMAEAAAGLGLPAQGWRKQARAEVARALRKAERALIFAAWLAIPEGQATATVARRHVGRSMRAPLRAPAGFARTRARPGPGWRRGFVRPFRRGVGFPRLEARLGRLRDLAAHRDRWIARLMRWLSAAMHGAPLRVVAPAATPLCTGAPRAVCAADTS